MQPTTFQYKNYGNGLFRPIITVDLTYNNKQVSMSALLDSGSDPTFFDRETADLLGIDLTTGDLGGTQGFKGKPIDLYYHQIYIGIKGFDLIPYMIGFASGAISDQYSGILGSEGFFNTYKVTMEYSHLISICPQVQPLKH